MCVCVCVCACVCVTLDKYLPLEVEDYLQEVGDHQMQYGHSSSERPIRSGSSDFDEYAEAFFEHAD